MPHLLRKSVIIGLGGTGLDAVLHVKQKFWQVHGQGKIGGDGRIQLPEGMRGVRFLVFDTTDPKTQQTESGGVVGLNPGEFVRLQVQDPGILLRQNREIRDWYPNDVPARAIFAGAGQIRALGRLALFANSDNVYQSIRHAFSDVRDFSVDRWSGAFEYPSSNLVIYVVGSLAGGTGAGTFLDVGFIVRSLMDNLDTAVAVLLLPDVFTSLPASDNVEPNAYGALKELDYFSEARPPFDTYYFNGEKIECRPPFDVIHLINNENVSGRLFNDVDYMTEVIGTGLFVSSGAAGQKSSDVWDNLKNQITGQGYWDGKKKPLYSSFGVSELLYDGERYAEIAADEMAVDLISKAFLSTSQDDVPAEVEGFIDQARIREDRADHVIDELLSLQGLQRFGLPSEFKKQVILEAHQRWPAYVETACANLKAMIEKNLDVLESSRQQHLDEHIGAMIRQQGGVNRARQFLSLLSSHVVEYRQMMMEEMGKFQNELGGMEASLKKLQQAGHRLTEQIIPAGRQKVEHHMRLFAQAVDQFVLIRAQIERRQSAAVFFGAFEQVIHQWIQSLENFVASIRLVSKRLADKLAHEKIGRRRIMPFVLEVEAPLPEVGDLRVSPEAFLAWLESARPHGLTSLMGAVTEDMEACLLEYARQQPSVVALRERSIDAVLLALPESKRWKYITDLYNMAEPMWHYEREYLGARRKVVSILLFGVGNTQSTFLTMEQLRERLPQVAVTYDPDIVDTGDARRIICLNTSAALPAYAIRYVKQRYRDPFFDENRPFTYHVHKGWDSLIPDLIPPTEAEEQRLFWSLALADPFALVKPVGNFYEVCSKRTGEKTRDYWMRLDQGRANAMRKFLEDQELVNEVREEIDEILRRLGNEQVLQGLIAYRERLKASVKGKGEVAQERRAQINSELEDLDRYITELKEL